MISGGVSLVLDAVLSSEVDGHDESEYRGQDTVSEADSVSLDVQRSICAWEDETGNAPSSLLQSASSQAD